MSKFSILTINVIESFSSEEIIWVLEIHVEQACEGWAGLGNLWEFLPWFFHFTSFSDHLMEEKQSAYWSPQQQSSRHLGSFISSTSSCNSETRFKIILVGLALRELIVRPPKLPPVPSFVSNFVHRHCSHRQSVFVVMIHPICHIDLALFQMASRQNWFNVKFSWFGIY